MGRFCQIVVTEFPPEMISLEVSWDKKKISFFDPFILAAPSGIENNSLWIFRDIQGKKVELVVRDNHTLILIHFLKRILGRIY